MKQQEKTNGYAHILKYMGVFGSVQGMTIGLGIIRNKLVAVLIGPAGVGIISLFNSAITLLTNTANMGLGVSGVRNVSEAYEAYDARRMATVVDMLRFCTLLAGLVGMALCLLLSMVLSKATFSDGEHMADFMLLSPVVALSCITVGETAILKGARMLRRLAQLTIVGLAVTILITIPLYYFYRERAIVPSLLVAAVVQTCATVLCSYRAFPLRLNWDMRHVRSGSAMIKLGLVFTLAGILGNGVDLFVRSFLNNAASLQTVGLYNAGYMLSVVYASTLFSALEADFFPRISAVNQLQYTTNVLVNRQIEVGLLIVGPLLVVFVLALPLLVPLLYSSAFAGVVPMVQVLSFNIFFRAISLPLEYIALAKGDSRTYLLLEVVYDVAFVVAVIGGMQLGGLWGMGLCLSVMGLFNLVLVACVVQKRFGYRMRRSVFRNIGLQLPWLMLAYATTFVHNMSVYCLVGLALVGISSYLSVGALRKKTRR
jgi:hypothetical protein